MLGRALRRRAEAGERLLGLDGRRPGAAVRVNWALGADALRKPELLSTTSVRRAEMTWIMPTSERTAHTRVTTSAKDATMICTRSAVLLGGFSGIPGSFMTR